MFHQKDQLNQKRRQHRIQKTGNKCIDLQKLSDHIRAEVWRASGELSPRKKKKEGKADKLYDSVTEWKISMRYIVERKLLRKEENSVRIAKETNS